MGKESIENITEDGWKREERITGVIKSSRYYGDSERAEIAVDGSH